MISLRSYQTDVIAALYRAIKDGKRRIILVAPTGAGKTVIGAAVIRDAVSKHKHVLVLAHRREIVQQTRDKLHELGIWCGVIMAGVTTQEAAPVQVAAVQTLDARAMRHGPNGETRMELPPATLVVVDECHHATAKTWRAILDQYPDAIVIGLTATPCRGDGRGLGGIFETMVECPQIGELIGAGHLVPTRVFAPASPDLAGVKTVRGDYHEAQLAHAMNRSALIADIVTEWIKHGQRRRTVCFATGVEHSLHIRDRFREAGVRAEHIDGGTPKTERDAILAMLESGEIEVVTNCMVLTEGWDQPAVSCCILARPTKQMGLFRQMVGRVLRPAPGKADAIILDHSGAVFRHGLPEDPVAWTLSEDKTARNACHDARKPDRPGGAKLLDCSQCGTLREGGKACPACGFLPARSARTFTCQDGDLALVQGGKAGKAEHDKLAWHRQLTAIQIEKGRSPKWILATFRNKFGHWPADRAVTPMNPTPEVRAYVRSRDIAYAKGMQKAREAAA
jgi:DNA repair protein RadD